MKPDLTLDLRWTLKCDGENYTLDPLVCDLLHGIRQGGHLNYAASQAGVSYRHAWGLLRDWGERLGKPLLSARQGRGAHLTAFGESLLEIVSNTTERLAPALASAALDAGAELSEASDSKRHPIGIASSHSPRVAALRNVLDAHHNVTLEIVGSAAALQRYRRGEADIAGFHLPMGDAARTVATPLIDLLDTKVDIVWLLEKRTLGFMSRANKYCDDFYQLADGQLRFVNRQPGSTTRLVFDQLLAATGIATDAINGYGDEEYTHTAVAALVASNNADVAFGTASAATQLKLRFSPIVDERFYVVVGRHADAALRRAIATFCAAQDIVEREMMKADEFNPTIAVLKRVHRAGFWKRAAPN